MDFIFNIDYEKESGFFQGGGLISTNSDLFFNSIILFISQLTLVDVCVLHLQVTTRATGINSFFSFLSFLKI